MSMRGKAWTPEMDRYLMERYADTENKVLAEETGYGIRTIRSHALKLGLEKSRELMRRTQLRASRAGSMAIEYMKITGAKRKRKVRLGGRPFQKGHHWDEETERKRVEAIRETAWQERRRMMHGMVRKTGWKMVNDFDKSE